MQRHRQREPRRDPRRDDAFLGRLGIILLFVVAVSFWAAGFCQQAQEGREGRRLREAGQANRPASIYAPVADGLASRREAEQGLLRRIESR